MSDDLNTLERAVIMQICKGNNQECPSLEQHVALLQVKSRDNTGVGLYVNFEYILGGSKKVEFNLTDIALSVNKIVELDNLKNGLGFILDISNGRINYLEFFTYGNELWDGSYNTFFFTGI